MSLLDAARKTLRALGISARAEPVPPGSSKSNGAAETTVNILRQQAGLFISQVEQSLGIPNTVSCQHPLYCWSLLHAGWTRNRFAVQQGQTSYERCCDRMYTGRICMYGETVLGFLKPQVKGSPRWCKGIWLGKTLNNDVHIIGVGESFCHKKCSQTRSTFQL